jgi:hypothetical protein
MSIPFARKELRDEPKSPDKVPTWNMISAFLQPVALPILTKENIGQNQKKYLSRNHKHNVYQEQTWSSLPVTKQG